MTATLTADTRAAVSREIVFRRVAASNQASERFFATNAESIARACQAMAQRFHRGGRLLVFGEGAQRSDVAHVVVEFLHPVIVGKRALPAIALASPDQAEVVGRDADILVVLAPGAPQDAENRLLTTAQRRGMLTLALGGSDVTRGDYCFDVACSDACIVQEVHEMLYHVLWELVHVFLDHRPVSA
jgi:D-sedoheptulose 7-phosphate isomerase